MNNPEFLPCPVCNADATYFSSADFNKSCEERRGKFLPETGVLIAYYRCQNCQFCYAPEFLQWQPEDFSTHIYNEAYVEVDPDYLELRPQNDAAMLQRNFGKNKNTIRHLDYGSGSGLMSRLLQGAGWNSTSYDPYGGSSAEHPLSGRFNLITAFEVFEHVPNVDALMKTLADLLDDDGFIMCSTMVSDKELGTGDLSWWYAAPRNGHISLYSSKSLRILGENHGLEIRSLDQGTHLFYRNQLPAWIGLKN